MVFSVEYVRWCAESMRSFRIVDDPAFHRLMKTGRPHLRVPSSRTVARDVHVVFKRVKERIAKTLQVSFSDYYIWLYTHRKSGIWRTSELCYGCLELAKQPCVCSLDCPFRAKRHPGYLSLGHCWSSCIPFRRNSGHRDCEDPGRLWHIRQGKH